ncbi:hypothetical protein [Asanoa siamensis]|uniref:Membrane protein YqaA with SNARE-associated domain n=1 Tax=Asanoa siamensis TaxID=926357 RepID=A0ABQ4D393_9ACTN|nr:hypothetical protein [Asanoa siamensis]GIF78002.1 hypothetical protein Asi02nite_75200 [Asanoa siamensis]
MITLAATVLVGFISAFVPVVPIEPYVVGLIATTSEHPVPVGVAAAVGQTAGKILIFLGARGLIRTAALRNWVTKRAQTKPGTAAASKIKQGGSRLLTLLDHPVTQGPIVLLSAAVGVPPLLVVSVWAARTRMGMGLFSGVCLLGRAIRLIAIAYAPEAFMS